jgi:tRNA 2-thiouridine synthesizing protein A
VSDERTSGGAHRPGETGAARDSAEGRPPGTDSVVTDASSPPPSAAWDAGDLGCGELVLELRMRLGAMRPGQVLRLIARDPGAPADLPAWCRMTGHALVSAEHPVYLIRRKES